MDTSFSLSERRVFCVLAKSWKKFVELWLVFWYDKKAELFDSLGVDSPTSYITPLGHRGEDWNMIGLFTETLI